MKLNVFEVVLTNHEAVYYSGQTLQGHVMLELSKDTKVSDIRMTVRGKAFVHLTEQTMRGPGEIRHRDIRHHWAKENYLDISKPLLTKGTVNGSENKRLLEAGQYTYPFQCQIPAISPSSFEGQYGYVRYWVKVTIERTWKEDVSVKRLFSVICPVDLNREPSAGQPVNNETQKRLCCLCCKSGPISASLHLSHKGYVPGESISVYADINNLSRREIDTSSVELLMTTKYVTPTKSRTVTKQVTMLQHGSISAGGCDNWDGVPLVLPPLPPSFLIGCGIIDLRYTLTLRVHPVGPGIELMVPVDILIGTVPLQATVERYLGHQSMTPAAVQPHGAARHPDMRPLPQIPTMFSPSSTSEIHLQDEDDDERTTLEPGFKPAYVSINLELARHQHQRKFVHYQQGRRES